MKKKIYRITLLLLTTTVLLCAKGKQTITVLVNPDVPPLESYTVFSGSRGFSIDLLEAVLNYENIKCEFIPNHKPHKSSRIHIIPTTPGTLPSMGNYVLSDPYISVRLNYVTQKSNPQEQIHEKHLAVIDNSIEHSYLIANRISDKITTVANFAEGAILVKEGLCDAMLICDKSSSLGIKIADLNGLVIESLGELGQIPLHFAVHKEEPELLKFINDGIALAKKEGVYSSIYSKWFDEMETADLTFWERYAIRIMGSILVLMCFVVIVLYIVTNSSINRTKRLGKQLEIAIQAGKASVWRYDIKDDQFTKIRGESWFSKSESLSSLTHQIHPEDRSKFIEAMGSIISEKQNTCEVVVRITSPINGKEYYIKTNLIGSTRNGKVNAIIGTRANISDDIIRQKQIIEAATKFSAVFDSTTVGLEYYNKDGILTDINSAALEIFGISNKESLIASQKNFFEDTVYGELLLNRGVNERHSLDLSYDLDRVEYDYLQKSTQTGVRNLHVKLSTLADSQGNCICYIVAIYDFTENINLNKEYIRLHKENSTILKTLPLSVATYDKNGYQTYINDAYMNTFGMPSSEEFLKKRVNLFNNPILTEEFKNKIRIGSDEVMIQESWLDLDSPEIAQYYDSSIGGVKRLSFIFKCITDNNNNLEQIIAITSDITQLHNTLIELREAKVKAEQSDKLKSAFLANMSHEIRTPLNAIVGFSDLLMQCDDEEDKIEFCKLIRSNNEHLLSLINDILDLSKIESGEIQINPTNFDLCELFDELNISFAIKIKPEIELTCSKQHSHLSVVLDKKRLTQLMNNFLSNAVKYTKQGNIHFGYEVVNGGIRVFVTDTGIGISDRYKDRVFKRFEKFDNFAQGTGLGLSICKALVTASNGEVGYESQEGEGSTFWAWMPCAISEMEEEVSDTAESSLPMSEVSKKALNGMKILIAEDNDSNYKLISIILRECSLHRATNGKEAVDMVMNNQYDVIFMDMRMPIMHGIEATRQIRAMGIKTPIVALTANVFDSDRENALAAGCDCFITKPIKTEEIMELLAPRGGGKLLYFSTLRKK